MLSSVPSISTTGLIRCLCVFCLLRVLLRVMAMAAVRGKGPWKRKPGMMSQNGNGKLVACYRKAWWSLQTSETLGAFHGAELSEVLKTRPGVGITTERATHTGQAGTAPALRHRLAATSQTSQWAQKPPGLNTGPWLFVCTKKPRSWQQLAIDANGESLTRSCDV